MSIVRDTYLLNCLFHLFSFLHLLPHNPFLRQAQVFIITLFFDNSALEIDHAGIFFSELEKRFMRTTFGNLSFFKDDDIVSTFHGLESMGYHDNRSSFEELFKGLCDLLFTITIERCGRFIQENNLGVFEKYLGNRETLFLPSAETNASFAYFCLKTIFEFIDKLTLSQLNRFFDFLFCFAISFDFSFD